MMKRFVSVITLFTILLNLSPANAITFGEEVSSASTEFPSVVSIWYTTSTTQEPIFYCTGTLIENDIVLTAAHCVEEKGVYFIKYGANLRKDSYLRSISATWISPNFSSDQLVGDVGLLKLTEPISGAQTIPLLTSNEIKKVLSDKKKKLQIVGWGKDQNSFFSQYLKKLSVDDYSSYMQKRYRSQWRPSIWIGVGKFDKSQRIYAGSCNGDSGGPLFAYSKGQQYLVGVTSFGAEDCEEFEPSVYTRLSAYATEIRNKGIQFVRLNEVTQNRSFPSLISEPKITGDAVAGGTVTCNPGQWSSNTTSISIQWSTSTGTYDAPSLKLNSTYSSRVLQCTVIGKNSNGEVKRILTIIQPATPVPPSTPYPSISGISSFSNTTVGTVARCSATSYASDVTMSYQWGYGSSWSVSSLTNPIGSGSTLTITQSILDAVKGKYLICMATATNSAGSSTGFTTQSVTGASASPTPTPTPTPTASPTPTPTPTPSATPTPTPTPTRTPTPSPTPTPTPSPTPTLASDTTPPVGSSWNSPFYTYPGGIYAPSFKATDNVSVNRTQFILVKNGIDVVTQAGSAIPGLTDFYSANMTIPSNASGVYGIRFEAFDSAGNKYSRFFDGSTTIVTTPVYLNGVSFSTTSSSTGRVKVGDTFSCGIGNWANLGSQYQVVCLWSNWTTGAQFEGPVFTVDQGLVDAVSNKTISFSLRIKNSSTGAVVGGYAQTTGGLESYLGGQVKAWSLDGPR